MEYRRCESWLIVTGKYGLPERVFQCAAICQDFASWRWTSDGEILALRVSTNPLKPIE
ncbi:hypothetical protein [Microbulbifer hainanensis]|uniref:hypothetical protein n=1 Tax=Microbulbifer hainanensis TaxID=2735675 RepID=UPI00186912BA|nr:hypothetical protein [Microbulbifer hainanensis]